MRGAFPHCEKHQVDEGVTPRASRVCVFLKVCIHSERHVEEALVERGVLAASPYCQLPPGLFTLLEWRLTVDHFKQRRVTPRPLRCLPSLHRYGWHHPLHDPWGGGGGTVVACGPGETPCACLPKPQPLELSSHARRAAELLRGLMLERPRVRKIRLACPARGEACANTAGAC